MGLKFKELHPNVKLRLIIGFFQRILNQMVIPFMAIYFSINFGLGLAGILSIIVIIIGILASFIGGYYADVIGRKPLLLISEFSTSFLFGLMAIFNSPYIFNPIITFLIFLLINSSINLGRPATDAIIIDVTTPKTRKYVYSINYWIINLSFAIGATIGSFLFKEFFFEALLVSSLLSFLIFIVYLLFITETKPNKNNKINKPWLIFKDYNLILKNSIFLKFFTAALFMMTIELQLTYYISARLANEFSTFIEVSNLNIDGVKMYGLLRTENTLGVVCLAFLIGKLFSKVKLEKQIYIGVIIFTLGYSILGSSNSFWILILAMLLATIGEMIHVPVKQSLLSVLIDDNNRTKYMAFYGLYDRVAMVISSVILSLGTIISSQFMSVIYIVLGGISMLLYHSILTDNKTKERLKELD